MKLNNKKYLNMLFRNNKINIKYGKNLRIGTYNLNYGVKEKIINEDSGIQVEPGISSDEINFDFFELAPYINTEWYNPIHHINDDFIIEYYVTDRYQEEYFNDKYIKEFIVTVNFDGEEIRRKVKAGNHKLNLGKPKRLGEIYFSIQALDLSNNYESCKHWKRLMSIDDSYEIKENEIYYMTAEDIINYGIVAKEGDSVKITDDEGVSNIVAMNKLMQDKRDEGFRKFVWYNPNGDTDDRYTYFVQPYNTRENPVKIPDGLTVDLNQCKWKQLLSYGSGSLMVSFTQDSTDSHLINGYVWGDYDEHIVNKNDPMYPTDSPGAGGIEGEGYNLISLTGAFNSIENLNAGWCTGYSICAGSNETVFSYSGKDFKTWKNVYINNKGEEVISDGDIWTNNMVALGADAISGASIEKYNFLQVNNRLGYSGLRGKANDIIISYFDENKLLLYREKVRQYGLSLIPKNAKYLRITLASNTSEEILSTGSTEFAIEYKNYKATTCWLCKDNYIHDCRTVAYATGVYDHLTFENELIEECGQRLGPNNGQVTALAIDIEDGYQHSEALYIKNVTCRGADTDNDGKSIGSNTINLVTVYDVHLYGDCNFNFKANKAFGLNIQNVNLSSGIYVGRMEHFRTGFMVMQNCNIIGDTIINTDSPNGPTSVIKNCYIRGQVNTYSATNTKNIIFKNCDITREPRGNLFVGPENCKGCKINFDHYQYFSNSFIYTNCLLESPIEGAMFVLHAANINIIFNNCDVNVNYNKSMYEHVTNSYLIFNNCKLNRKYYEENQDFIIKNNCELVDF